MTTPAKCFRACDRELLTALPKRSAPTPHIAHFRLSTSIIRAVRTPHAGLALESIECRHEIIRLVLFHRLRDRMPKCRVQGRIFRPFRRRPVCGGERLHVRVERVGIQNVECAAGIQRCFPSLLGAIVRIVDHDLIFVRVAKEDISDDMRAVAIYDLVE
ncbi:hypothetical protein KC356_g71 [Hortaea werneckii]|nr:hypothetical protein KC356_g71 [Hortaea werneckii]